VEDQPADEPVDLGDDWEEIPVEPAADPVAALPMPQRKSKQEPEQSSLPTETPQRTHDPVTVISEKQAKRLYAIAMSIEGMDAKKYSEWLASYGYSHSNEVPVDRYEELASELEAAKGAAK
jgi:hypothetical protein